MFKSRPEAAAAVNVAMDSGRLPGEVGVVGEVAFVCLPKRKLYHVSRPVVNINENDKHHSSFS